MSDEPAEGVRRARGCLTAVGVVLVVIVVCVLLLQYFSPYNSLRREAVQNVGVAELQAWAISVLDEPPDQFAADAIMDNTLREADVPPEIRRLAGRFCWIVYVEARPDAGREEHIHFACGGGFYHFGLRVGRPGFTPTEHPMTEVEQLGKGVWSYYER